MEQVRVHELRWRGIGKREKPFYIKANPERYVRHFYDTQLEPDKLASDYSTEFIRYVNARDPFVGAHHPMMYSYGPSEYRKRHKNWPRRFDDSGKVLHPMIEYIQTRSLPKDEAERLMKPMSEYFWEAAVYTDIPYWSNRLADLYTNYYLAAVSKFADSALQLYIRRNLKTEVCQQFKATFFVKYCYLFDLWQKLNSRLPDGIFRKAIPSEGPAAQMIKVVDMLSLTVKVTKMIGGPFLSSELSNAMNPIITNAMTKPAVMLPEEDQIPLSGVSLTDAIAHFLNTGIFDDDRQKYRPVLDVIMKYFGDGIKPIPGKQTEAIEMKTLQTDQPDANGRMFSSVLLQDIVDDPMMNLIHIGSIYDVPVRTLADFDER